jgi:predicted amidophosphoribosyltransferase
MVVDYKLIKLYNGKHIKLDEQKFCCIRKISPSEEEEEEEGNVEHQNNKQYQKLQKKKNRFNEFSFIIYNEQIHKLMHQYY